MTSDKPVVNTIVTAQQRIKKKGLHLIEQTFYIVTPNYNF